MPLGPEERTRHARHLLLGEIGEQGQARLCAARFSVPGSADPRAAAVLREYLVRAGLQEAAGGPPVALPTPEQVRGHAGDEALEPAAAAALGAFAAVEAIKAVVGAGVPATLPDGWSLGPPE